MCSRIRSDRHSRYSTSRLRPSRGGHSYVCWDKSQNFGPAFQCVDHGSLRTCSCVSGCENHGGHCCSRMSGTLGQVLAYVTELLGAIRQRIRIKGSQVNAQQSVEFNAPNCGPCLLHQTIAPPNREDSDGRISVCRLPLSQADGDDTCQ